jgi:hypothetical protein
MPQYKHQTIFDQFGFTIMEDNARRGLRVFYNEVEWQSKVYPKITIAEIIDTAKGPQARFTKLNPTQIDRGSYNRQISMPATSEMIAKLVTSLIEMDRKLADATAPRPRPEPEQSDFESHPRPAPVQPEATPADTRPTRAQQPVATQAEPRPLRPPAIIPASESGQAQDYLQQATERELDVDAKRIMAQESDF